MGDRANVFVKDDFNNEVGVYLYTHWGGSELPQTLQRALAKKWRWDDSAYLARIIFDEMTKGYTGEETGFGISAFVGDGDDRILEVDCNKKTVTCRGKTVSFEEYIDNPLTW